MDILRGGSASPVARSFKLKRLAGIAVTALAILVVGASVWLFLQWQARLAKGEASRASAAELDELWRDARVDEILAITENALRESPLSFYALAYRSFARFQKSFEEESAERKLSNLADSITCARKALTSMRDRKVFELALRYTLGRAYFHMSLGDELVGDYEFRPYADLCIQELEKARSLGCANEDVVPYLALASETLARVSKDYVESGLAYFNEAFEVSDNLALRVRYAKLLGAIGRKSEEKAFLASLLADREGGDLAGAVHSARIELGTLLMEEKLYSAAEKEFKAVIDQDALNVRAYYLLSSCYEAMGDTVRSRSMLRKAREIDPSIR
jgi:tetratricopeptide (TPR) repeat protein